MLNFFCFVSILGYKLLKFNVMTTRISTSSANSFTKIQKYLSKKRVVFTSSLYYGVYTFFVFDLTKIDTTSLINIMTKRLHLTKQQEPLALAA